jgi:hypothetical protein
VDDNPLTDNKAAGVLDSPILVQRDWGRTKMWRLSNRARILIIFFSVLLIGCVGFVQFVLWRANQISPASLSANRTAYRSIRECDDRFLEENPHFVACIKKARDAVEVVQNTARTQRERMEYANLHGYLIQVGNCHRDWRSSDKSADAEARHEQLVRIRNHMEKSYK